VQRQYHTYVHDSLVGFLQTYGMRSSQSRSFHTAEMVILAQLLDNSG